MAQLFRFLVILWNHLREICGENDYERHRERVLKRGGSPPTREKFFLERLELKYTRPNRCC